MISRGKLFLAVACLLVSLSSFAQIGDGPVIREHLDQAHIEAGHVSWYDLLEKGEDLFVAKFNTYDGQGRPATTGGGAARTAGSAPLFLRTSAPDSNACAGCHNDPFIGGAGDIVANVFVLAQVLDPVTESVSPQFSNNRNTVGMHGAGPIEMLAREMSTDLIYIRNLAAAEASTNRVNVTKKLVTKGVEFGYITARPDGTFDTSAVQGVDANLVIKPFHQKGVVTSLREFTNNAMNHHHGMQSTERFGVARTGTHDFDKDGVEDELTVGDITATSIWQAALATPGQVIPNDAERARAIIMGERLFTGIGCGDCHVPSMILNNPVFSEPNPYNPAGNLSVAEVSKTVDFDMTEQGFGPRIERRYDGKAVVRAFTDLKRHNLCDADYDHFCNEQVVQGGVPTEQFLTRKLWDAGNTAPYGHVGDLTTLTEAIYYHGGEARGQRDAFFAMDEMDRAYVIEFLKSLQILPDNAEGLIVDENGKAQSKTAMAHKLGIDADVETSSVVNRRR